MDYMYIRFTCYIDTFKSANLTFSVCFNVQILPKNGKMQSKTVHTAITYHPIQIMIKHLFFYLHTEPALLA